VNVPDHIRDELRSRLGGIADEIGWSNLPAADKTRYYEDWTRDPTVGGVLSRYMDTRQVRVYIKDTILKHYTHHRLVDHARPFRVLGLREDYPVTERYQKPHGRRLRDGRVVCWGQASEWKSVLMALHERTFGKVGIKPFAAVLLGATGRYHEPALRTLVEHAAIRLGVERVIWLET
jgi:hypothetical protein